MKIILCVIIVFILSISIINQITVKPFISMFRTLINIADKQGNIGPHFEAIESVKELDRVIVPVESYPDAEITYFAPNGNEDILPVVIYIHGGGWSMGTSQAVQWFAELIASNRYIIANVEYAYAPENPYPASTIQLATIIDYIYTNSDRYNIDATKVFIGGNSAGAHLASQLGALVTNSTLADELGITPRTPKESIRGLLLFNGVYDFNTVGECNYPFFNKFAWAYTGVKEYLNYERLNELSTINYITEDYPATFITVGDSDPLSSQTYDFIERLEEYNVFYNSLLWDGTGKKLDHDYIYEQQTEEGQKAYEMAISFLNEMSK